jgi:hypothetical protein
MDTVSSSQPEWIDLKQVEGAFDFEEGFTRPDWKVIHRAVAQRAAGLDELQAVWVQVARQWVQRLRSDLGGEYQVRESRAFLLLSALGEEASDKVLAFAERTREQICAQLRDAAWTSGLGKHVILLFAEEDDYYQYVSWFHRDGTHPTSGGCLLSGGYTHIAAPYEPFTVRRMLAHELTHNLLAHHPYLPLWLNEGLATTCDRSVSSEPAPVLDAELKQRHLEFWNEENIQKFWSGVSWREPGVSNELSYNLAEIMVILLSEQGGNWGAFVKQAHADDAGQTAALDCLGMDLGDAMARFLGEGSWRPRRKAIKTLWEDSKREGGSPEY